MTTAGVLLIVLSIPIGVIGSYLLTDSLVPKLLGFGLMGIGFILVGPHMRATMKKKRQQADEYWDRHPGNPDNASKVNCE